MPARLARRPSRSASITCGTVTAGAAPSSITAGKPISSIRRPVLGTIG